METARDQVRASQDEIEGPQLLTARELAKALKLNPQTLYRLTRRGLIPSIRIGKKMLRFDPLRVKAALESESTPVRTIGRLSAPAGRLSFTRLEDLVAQGRWMTPPPGLILERFAPRFPRDIDITALAYERKRP